MRDSDKNYYGTDEKSGKKNNSEIIGVSVMAFSAFFLLCLIFSFVIGPIGAYIKGFLTGTFGLSIYAGFIGAFLLGFMKYKKRKITLPLYKTVSSIGMLVFALLFVHLISSAHLLKTDSSFSEYAGACYSSGLTVGGVISGTLVYPVASIAGKVFTFIFIAFLFAVCALGFTNFSLLKPKPKVVVEPDEDNGVHRLDEGFFKDYSRSAKQVQPVGNKTLFVSQIKAKQTSSTGEISKVPIKKVADLNENVTTYSKAEQAHNKLYNFFESEKDNRSKTDDRNKENPYKAHFSAKQTGVNQAYSDSIERARNAAGAEINSNLSSSRPPDYAKTADYTKPAEYGVQSYGQNNLNRYSNSQYNGNANADLKPSVPTEDSEDKYRQENYNLFRSMMPDKLYGQPSIKKDEPQKIVHSGQTQHYNNIIDGEKYAEKNKAEKKPEIKQEPPKEAPPAFKVPKIIDGESYSRQLEENRKREQEAKRGENAKADLRPDFNQNYVSAPKPKAQKFIIGDLESEKLANQKQIEQLRADSMSNMKKQFEQKKPPILNAAKPEPSVMPEYNAASKTLKPSDEFKIPEPVQPKFEKQEKHEKESDNILENNIPIDFSRIFTKKDKIEERPAEEYDKEIFEELTEAEEDKSAKERWEEKVEALEKINSELNQSSFIFRDEQKDYKPATSANLKANADNKSVIKDQVVLEDYMQSTSGAAAEKAPVYSPKRKRGSKYVPPLIELLDNSSTFTGIADNSSKERGDLLENTLKQFNAPAKVIGITKGPAVTRFELQMSPGIPVAKVRSAADDIAYALAAKAGVRIEAPIPGRQAVGVEVPNEKIDIVSLREIIDSKEFNSHESSLCFALGKDIAGKNIVCDLCKMPHLLIAGATNSGKSSCLNSLITSLIYKTSPEDLRFILIDPKRVEFVNYEGLPHLLLERAITTPQAALNALNWAMEETERRYTTFASLRVRDFKEYAKCEAVTIGESEKIPYIVIVVDELADLMMDSKKEFEDKVRYIAQKSRAAGIHLVLATQRPSVDVITGTIKANLPSRIAFSVTNFQDSKTILDSGGAEKLLGRGDMLYAPIDQAEPYRVQGAYVTSNEVTAVVDYVTKNNESIFDESVKDIIYAVKPDPNAKPEVDEDDGEQEFDPIMPKVLKYFIDSGKASISIVQRKFGVGFNRAANIVDYLEMKKFVGASDGTSKQRSVNITLSEFENIFGDIEY